MTEASKPPLVIEGIEIRTWAIHLRDTQSRELHEVEFRGNGPWTVDVEGKTALKQVAPPPDDAITLRLQRAANNVRVAAVGRGAKAWSAAQGALLGSKWFLDTMGAPVVVLEDRSTLVEEIKSALPSITLDLSKYTDTPADAPAVADRTAAPTGPDLPVASTPAAGPKKGGRGFGGKVEVPPDVDIQFILSNAGRSDGMVSLTASKLREGVTSDAVRAWVERRSIFPGAWKPLDGDQVAVVRDGRTFPEDLHKALPEVRLDVRQYSRPGVQLTKIPPEDMKYPEVIASLDRQDPRAITILHHIIREIADVFIVAPLASGHGYRTVELLTDRPTGIYDGLPIGTTLVQVRLRHDADPTLSATDWAPLKKTLRALGRPEKQLQMLREYVAGVLTKASQAARRQQDPSANPTPDPTTRAGSERLPSPAATRGRKRAEPAAGPGPGDLVWTPIVDKGTEGLAARWGEGQFKLLHVGADRYGLFYEHDSGGYETLLCGTLDEGKAAAGERAAGRPTVDLKAAQAACAGARKAGPPTNDEITLRLRSLAGQRPDLMILATGDRAHEWVFGHDSILGHAWERGGEDNFPMATMFDKPTIIPDLRKEFPGVKIDTSDYQKPKADAEPAAAAAEPAALPSAPRPSAAAPADDGSQDAELLHSIKSQLADMLDEED